MAPRLKNVLGLACLAAAAALLLRFKRRGLGLHGLGPIDIVERSSMESFPASDSPPWNPPGAFEIR